MMFFVAIPKDIAKARGLSHYFNFEPCKHGHFAPRFVSNMHCITCKRAREKSESTRAWRSQYYAKWHADNREKIRARKLEWYARNRSDVLSKQYIFKKENPDRMRLAASIRRSRMRKAMPSWADLDAIKRVYVTCPEGFHVDHIIPLKGVTAEGFQVSGLHVAGNLRHISAYENLSRQNRMNREDMMIVESQ